MTVPRAVRCVEVHSVRYVPPDRAEEIRAGGVPLVPVEDVVRSVMGIVTNDSVTGAVAVVDRGEMLG